jgi:hypothetical protein
MLASPSVAASLTVADTSTRGTLPMLQAIRLRFLWWRYERCLFAFYRAALRG